jgi:hypothetical protein
MSCGYAHKMVIARRRAGQRGFPTCGPVEAAETFKQPWGEMTRFGGSS